MTHEEKKTIHYILGNILSSIIKEDDAPCSSQSHMSTALTELAKLLDFDYNFYFREYDKTLNDYFSFAETMLSLEQASKFLGKDVTIISELKDYILPLYGVPMYRLIEYKEKYENTQNDT